MISTVASIVLGVTFVVSAAAKARMGRRALGEALTVSGVPAPAAGPLAVVLPLVEGGLGVALVVAARSPWPAWVALAVLVAFTAFLVLTLDRDAPCPCFGAGARGAPGARAIVRNLVLVALAVIATGP